MNDPSIKKRITRARRLAINSLIQAGYGVIETNGEPFTVIGVRPAEARFIRVVLDKSFGPEDQAACKKVTVPGNCSREIWALPRSGREFRIISL